MSVQLLQGDCLELMRDLPHVDAVITDPPYGMNLDTDYTRFSGSLAPNINHGGSIIGDDKPFDPSPFLDLAPIVVMFGLNHFCTRLPSGGAFVWLKKRDSQIGTFLSDCEIAWVKGIQGVYIHRHVWHGFDRDGERGTKVLRPTQKPVGLMRWVLQKAGVKAGMTVFDPYMGSGSTGLACLELGINFIGCEIDAAYFDIATKRINDAQQQQAFNLEAVPA